MDDYKVWKTLEPSPAPGIQCYRCSESDNSYPWYLHEYAGKNVFLRLYELQGNSFPCVSQMLATWIAAEERFTATSCTHMWDLTTGKRIVRTTDCPVKAVRLHVCYCNKRLYFSRNKRTLKTFVTKELL